MYRGLMKDHYYLAQLVAAVDAVAVQGRRGRGRGVPRPGTRRRRHRPGAVSRLVLEGLEPGLGRRGPSSLVRVHLRSLGNDCLELSKCV